MSVTPTTATTTPTTSTDTTALGRARLADNFDTFLTLLTTQLKNQDPLSPLDSNQFTQQMVSMTGVEQQLATNDLLKQLVGNTGSNMATAVSLIGKDVRATSSTTALANDQAKWIYNLDHTASTVKIEVVDGAGRVVHAEQSEGTSAGDHTFTWDGTGPGGAKQPNGVYSVRVTATDADAQAVPTTVSVQGIVTAIEQANGGTLLTINGGKVSWDNVTVVNQPAAPATGSPSTAG
jgi:flagellar basal-body rod modification protein FlgD